LASGLALLNAVALPVNWRLAPAEIAQVITDTQAEVVVTGPDFVPQLEKVEHELPTVKTSLPSAATPGGSTTRAGSGPYRPSIRASSPLRAMSPFSFTRRAPPACPRA